MKLFLPPSLIDLKALRSSESYYAFFKDIRHADFVSNILTSITKGTQATLLDPRSGIGVSSPVIACVQDDPDLVDDTALLGLRPSLQKAAKEGCATNPSSAMWIGQTQAIILCPRFFRHKLKPPRRACPLVDSATNKFKTVGNGIANTQAYSLLHELVHLYLGTVIDQAGLPGEKYPIQDCFDLYSHRARYNPANYVYYVNCKYSNACRRNRPWKKEKDDAS